jgi:hypothetical protein
MKMGVELVGGMAKSAENLSTWEKIKKHFNSDSDEKGRRETLGSGERQRSDDVVTQ